MKYFAPLALIAAAWAGFAPAAAADDSCHEAPPIAPAAPVAEAWETQTVTEPGRWEVTHQTVTEPGRWEHRTQRVLVEPGRWITRRGRHGGVHVGVDLGPVHLDFGRRRHRARGHHRVWIPPRYEVRTERVWVPGRTVTRPVRRWVPPTTRTVRVRAHRVDSLRHRLESRRAQRFDSRRVRGYDSWPAPTPQTCCAERRRGDRCAHGVVSAPLPEARPLPEAQPLPQRTWPRGTRTVRNLLD